MMPLEVDRDIVFGREKFSNLLPYISICLLRIFSMETLPIFRIANLSKGYYFMQCRKFKGLEAIVLVEITEQVFLNTFHALFYVVCTRRVCD